MRPIRLFGSFVALLLAVMVMASEAYAHGPTAHSNHASQPGKSDSGDVISPRGERNQAPELTIAVHNQHPLPDCAGGSSDQCCSHHCCTGATAVSEYRSPTLVTGSRIAQVPPDAPDDRTLSELLRPPCR